MSGLTSFTLGSNSRPTNHSCIVMLDFESPFFVRGFGQILNDI